MNIKDKLISVGLGAQESTVYLALVELQEAKTGKLCSHTNMASSNIYKVLETLLSKGLISYKVDNNIKIFYPAPVERLNDLILEKEKKLEEQRKEITELVSNLKKYEDEKYTPSNYKYFEGIGGIISMWAEITNNIEPNSKAFIFAAKLEAYKKMIPYYDEFHRERVKNNMKAKIILPTTDEQLATRRKQEIAEVKFYDLQNNSELGTVGDYVYIQYVTEKKPRGFLIKDEVFAHSFNFLLEEFWKNID